MSEGLLCREARPGKGPLFDWLPTLRGGGGEWGVDVRTPPSSRQYDKKKNQNHITRKKEEKEEEEEEKSEEEKKEG